MLRWAEWHKISSTEGDASLMNAGGTWQAVQTLIRIDHNRVQLKEIFARTMKHEIFFYN